MRTKRTKRREADDKERQDQPEAKGAWAALKRAFGKLMDDLVEKTPPAERWHG